MARGVLVEFDLLWLATDSRSLRAPNPALYPTTHFLLEDARVLSGIYSAASAMDVTTRQHEITANNLANANVPGFRRTLLAVTTAGVNEANDNGRVRTNLRGATIARTYTDFSPGKYMSTGRKLDFAVQGDGFFVVETPEGLRYTRNGSFHLDDQGQLVNSEGMPIQGTGGPLVVPPQTAPEAMTIDDAGTLRIGENEIGKLDIVTFDNPDRLVQTGPTRFQAPPDAAPVPAEAARIAQGVLESGNASVVDEMIAMISGMRHFQAAQEGLRSISEAIRQFTTMQG